MNKRPDGTYAATDRPYWLILGLLVFAFGFGSAAVHRYALQGLDLGTIGFCLAIGVFGVGALAVPSTQFIFDPDRKIINWNSRSILSGNGGQLNFSDVKKVVVQSSLSRNTVMYRISLRTENDTLPLSIAYGAGLERYKTSASELSSLLGLPSQDIEVEPPIGIPSPQGAPPRLKEVKHESSSSSGRNA